MANIAVTTAGYISVVESTIQDTHPAAEAILAGALVRIDTTGKFTNGNATTTTENSVYGIATASVTAGFPVTAIRKGVLDGFNFTAQAMDAAIFASDTDGRIADAAGTTSVKVGRVISAHATRIGVTADKLLFVDLAN